MRKVLSKAGAIAMLGTAILMVPSSAGAATTASDISTCLTVSRAVGSNSAAVWYQYDRCGGRAIKSRIRLSGATDEACHTLRFNQGYRDEWFVGSWDGLKAC